MQEQKIGKVSHYYTHLGVGIIEIEKENLKVGETVHFKGRTTDFQQTIVSMQVEHANVQEAKAGALVGIKVDQHVREHDEVFKIV